MQVEVCSAQGSWHTFQPEPNIDYDVECHGTGWCEVFKFIFDPLTIGALPTKKLQATFFRPSSVIRKV